MISFNEITTEAIKKALLVPPDKRTRHQRLLLQLQNGQWVGGYDLLKKSGGMGFSARIAELRKKASKLSVGRQSILRRGNAGMNTDYRHRMEAIADKTNQNTILGFIKHGGE